MTPTESMASRPPVRQLTLRAVLLGAVLGVVTGISNLYVALEIGWSLGVVVTASLMGWALAAALHRLRVLRTPLSILEANCMASTASAAGYSTGVNLASAMAAHAMVTGAHLPLVPMAIWTLAVATLGVLVAVPLERRLVRVQALPFPTGRAAAETLSRLFSGGARAAVRPLAWGLSIGGVIALATEGVPAIAALLGRPGLAALALPPALPSTAMVDALPWLGGLVAAGVTLPLSVVMPAAGAIAGPRIAASLGLGTVVCFGVLAPAWVASGAIADRSWAATVSLSLWIGVPMMVVAALLDLVGQRGTLARGLSDLRTDPPAPVGPLALSGRRTIAAIAAVGAVCVTMQARWFAIPIPVGVAGVVAALALAVVAARVTAETDVTPAGPLGKLVQLGGAAAMPGAVVANVMATSVTVGAATSAADLLTDFKAGRLLGADPRRQLVAQLAGVLVGAAIIVPIFARVLVPDPALLGTARWPAPAAVVWRTVAQALAGATSTLPAHAGAAALAGSAVAVALVLAARRLPPRAARLLPHPTALGLSFVLPVSTAIGFVLGGLATALVVRARGPGALQVALPAAAGLIAGESLVGFLAALPR